MKWYEEPMVISAVQGSYSDSYDVLSTFTTPYFNVEQLFHTHAENAFAYYDDALHAETLDAYLEKSRKLGLREIVYTNIHSAGLNYAAEHPEFIRRNQDGSHMPAYVTQALLCVNEPYTAEVVKQVEAMCRHDIDGIFLDGPVARGACFCENCQTAFRAQFGKAVEDATPAEIMKFNISRLTAFVKACYEATKRIKPEVVLYINNSALRADVTGSSTREIYDYVDFLGAEGGFVRASKNTTNWPVSPMAKMIETQAEGKPCVTFIAGDYKPWSFCMHTAEETILYYAQALANGTNVWYGVHGPISQALDTPGGQAALQLNRFILANKAVFTNHKPVSNVALLWSQNSANYYRSSVTTTDFTARQNVGADSDIKSDHSAAFAGCFEMLVRNHIQHDVIDEISILKDRISRYDLLIMPTAACLSDEAAEKIRAFVAAGGTLISTYDTGFYEAEGMMARTPKLADVQGINAVNKLVRYKIPGSSYIVADEKNLYTQGVSWQHVPGCNFAADVAVADDAVVCAKCNEPMPSCYVPFPTDFFPAIIENKYGKGKSIYFTCDIGEMNNTFANPDVTKLFINAVRSGASAIVTTDAPGSVELVLRKCEDGYALHCINFTGEMVRPLNRIIPLYDVRVELAITDAEGRVDSVTGAKAVDVKKTDAGISFTISCMKEYEVFTVK